jgi:TonB family protein
MMLLYGFFYIFMYRETWFKLNRIFLITSVLLSLLIPLLKFGFVSSAGTANDSYLLRTVQVLSIPETGSMFSISVQEVIMYIYLAGLIIFSVRFILRLASILDLSFNSDSLYRNGLKIGLCTKAVSPFSFFKVVYINEKEKDSKGLDKILLHESVHIRQWHSVDVIISEIACIIVWFNPAIWMIRSALKETHEYLADSGVKELTKDTAGYFQLLFSSVIGVQPGLANNFNKSLTLKRMKMMTKKRSGSISFMKVLLVIPLVVILTVSFSFRTSIAGPALIHTPALHESVIANIPADKEPEFPGGFDAMVKYLIKNVKYPEQAKKNGTQGKVFVSFTVTKKGKIQNVKVTQSVNAELDAEAVRVISSMPDWNPGLKDGKPVDAEMTVPIQFKLG